MSDMVVNPEARLARIAAQMIVDFFSTEDPIPVRDTTKTTDTQKGKKLFLGGRDKQIL